MERIIRVRGVVTADHRAVLDLPAEVPPGEHTFEIGLPVPDTDVRVFEVVLSDDRRPRAFPTRPTHPKLAAEYDAFERMLPDLMREYAGRYVAIADGRVVAVGRSEVDVLTTAYNADPTALPLARLVTDQPQPIPRAGGLRELRPVG